MNYNETYACTGCGEIGVKLWRDYNTCASAIELKCATCLTPSRKFGDARDNEPEANDSPYDDDGVFTFRNGDQLGGMVPAVTTEDGDTFWGYTSVPADRVQWWYSMPTYRDDALEIRCLENSLARVRVDFWIDQIVSVRRQIAALRPALDVPSPRSGLEATNEPVRSATVEALRAALLTALRTSDASYHEWRELDELAKDLRWQDERIIYRVTKTCNVTIWGSVTEPAGDGYVIRYGKEMLRTLQPGDRVALHSDRAVLLLGETMRECPSIMDYDQDGERLIASLHANDCAVLDKNSTAAGPA